MTDLLTVLSTHAFVLMLSLLCCCGPKPKGEITALGEGRDSLQFDPYYGLCDAVVNAVLDFEYDKQKIYYLEDMSRHPLVLSEGTINMRPGDNMVEVEVDGQQHLVGKDSCLQILSRGDYGIYYSSIAWDDLVHFADLNGGWTREIKRIISESVMASKYLQPGFKGVAKLNEFQTTSIFKTYWSGDELSSEVLYAAHPKEELSTKMKAVEMSPLILMMKDVATSFSIRYPVRYFRMDQLESWEEFEQRMERSKEEND